MAPPLYLAPRERSDAGSSTPGPSTSEPNTSWIIAPIIAGTILFSAIAVYVIRRLLKLRQQRSQHKEMTEDPCSPRKSFIGRRKPTELGRLSEAEEQRAMMIRKSIAERSSAHSRRHESVSSLTSMLAPSVDEKSGDESGSDGEGEDTTLRGRKRGSGGLRDDWKEFEARVHRERSYSGEVHPAGHPASQPDVHPAFRPALVARPQPYQDLPLPSRTVTRSRSASQNSLPSRDIPSLRDHAVASPPMGDRPRYDAGPGGEGRERPSEIPGIAIHGAE